MKQTAKSKLLWPIPALILFGWLTSHFWFTQDDAYITYRYVANFLSGHGLVYNLGERVEGFTNFGWTLLLILIGRCGLDFVLASKIIGLLCGAGVVVFSGLIVRRLVRRDDWLLAGLTSLLVASNSSLAYWSQAGLETGPFCLAITCAIFLYIARSTLLGWVVLIAALLRPEGALLIPLLLIAAVFDRERRLLALATTAVIILFYLPLEIFRLTYYGTLLPNPFYAKTSLDLQQLQAGLSYAAEFLANYGLLGLPVLLSLVLWRRLTSEVRTIVVMILVWGGYVILIGGDVLKINRFFLPIAGVYAVLATVTFDSLASRFLSSARYVSVALILVAAVLTIWLPYQQIRVVLKNEIGLVSGMTQLAKSLQWVDKSDFSLGATTIGALGYYAGEHRLIDMLGLTDSTIAKNPEPENEALQSTWRERNYNSAYVLDRSPDYIIFSTSARPSAPAEQALMLQPRFLSDYRITSIPAVGENGMVSGFMNVYRQVRKSTALPGQPLPDSFVIAYKAGLEAMDRSGFDQAIGLFETAERIGGTAGRYPELRYFEANCLRHLERNLEAYQLLNEILSADSMVLGPHRDLFPIEYRLGDMPKAAIHRRYVELFSPIEAMMLDSMVLRK